MGNGVRHNLLRYKTVPLLMWDFKKAFEKENLRLRYRKIDWFQQPNKMPGSKVFNRFMVVLLILEVLELLISVAIVSVTGSAASGITNDLQFENLPGKLIYNIIIVSVVALYPRLSK